jgi:tetratricopeptide (TPR) repeat protein
MPSLPILCACILLLLATLAAYRGLGSNGFVFFDDDLFVTANPHVQKGLQGESIAWAFTTTHASNWHPLTWLSHMLDVQLFGLDPGKHHRSNLLLHALNALLLLLVLHRLTGALWRSALVAALFALHPLHVESVAWIAERKDLLSTLFWLLTLAAWLAFVRSRRAAPYLLAVLLYALGLMAKPMLVTLPFTLLLLDYWPLGRLPVPLRGQAATLRRLLLEKAPLFALSAASCVVTFHAQRAGGAVATLEHISLGDRIANAVWAYGAYLAKTLWPADLAVFYPLPPGGHPAGEVALAVLLLLGLSAGALRLAGRAPYLLTGWLWTLGTLVPVIGLVQVGSQAMADRYTYVPLIGIFLAAAWGLDALVAGHPAARGAAALAAVGALAAMFAATRQQTAYWKDTETLFGRAVAVTSGNWLAHDFIGLSLAFSGQDRMEEAIRHFEEAIGIDPRHPGVHNNLAMALRESGRLDEAVAHYQEALRLRPDAPVPLKNLGTTLLQMGRHSEAVDALARSVRLAPDDSDALLLLGQALEGTGRVSEALLQFEAALRLSPDSVSVLLRTGQALGKLGRTGEAAACFERALKIDTECLDALINLGVALDLMGRDQEALARFDAALRISPHSVQALVGKGTTLGRSGRVAEAVACLEKAVEADPGSPLARFNLAVALHASGRAGAALAHLHEALRLNPGDPAVIDAIATIQRSSRQGR